MAAIDKYSLSDLAEQALVTDVTAFGDLEGEAAKDLAEKGYITDVTVFGDDDSKSDDPSTDRVSDEAGLKDAIAAGKKVVLDSGISLASTLVIGDDKDVDIDLNGKTLSAPADAGSAIRVDKGHLHLSGDGVVKGASGRSDNAVWANGGSITIDGGTYSMGPDENGEGNSTIYNSGDGAVEINGGSFSSDAQWGGRYWTLNKKNGTKGTISVKGGTFKGFDPAHPSTDDDVTYLADGYVSTKVGDDYVVTPAPKAKAVKKHSSK